jgi:hypothetical protein
VKGKLVIEREDGDEREERERREEGNSGEREREEGVERKGREGREGRGERGELLFQVRFYLTQPNLKVYYNRAMYLTCIGT